MIIRFLLPALFLAASLVACAQDSDDPIVVEKPVEESALTSSIISKKDIIDRKVQEFSVVREAVDMVDWTEVGPSQATLSVVRACIGAKLQTKDQAASCVGLILDSCPGVDGSTTEMVMCNAKAADFWDGRLNETYATLQTRLSAEDEDAKGYSAVDVSLSEKLRDTQRAWIAYRDAACDFAYNEFRGGTLGRVTGASCYRDMTAERALELETTLAEMTGR